MSAFHWAGVKASTVAARPLVALVAVLIWLLRSLIRGCTRGLVGRGHPCLRLGRVRGELRDGGGGGVVGLGGDAGGGQHQPVDAVAAEDRPEVVGRLLQRAVTLDRLVELLQRCDVGAEVRRQGGLARAEALGRVDLGDGRVEVVDPIGDVRGRFGLDAGQGRRDRAGAAAGRRSWRRRAAAVPARVPSAAPEARAMAPSRINRVRACDMCAPLVRAPGMPGAGVGHGARSR